MCQIIEMEVDLSMPQSDGCSKREHLESIQRQTGQPIPDLEVPKVPIGGEWFKFLFDNISIGRQSGTQMLSNTEIKAWCDLTHTELGYFDLTMLRHLDKAYVNKVMELTSKRNKSG